MGTEAVTTPLRHPGDQSCDLKCSAWNRRVSAFHDFRNEAFDAFPREESKRADGEGSDGCGAGQLSPSVLGGLNGVKSSLRALILIRAADDAALWTSSRVEMAVELVLETKGASGVLRVPLEGVTVGHWQDFELGSAGTSFRRPWSR